MVRETTFRSVELGLLQCTLKASCITVYFILFAGPDQHGRGGSEVCVDDVEVDIFVSLLRRHVVVLDQDIEDDVSVVHNALNKLIAMLRCRDAHDG